MTVLSDKDIRAELEKGDLEVEPVDLEEQLQPCSLDIRLGDEFSKYRRKESAVSLGKEDTIERHMDSFNRDEYITIQPDDFILANTQETIEIPEDIGAELRGRSSLGRMGIEIHSCAGWIDSGFSGEIVLEISNNSSRPIRLDVGMRVAQLVFYTLSSRPEKSYGERNNKYQGQKGAVASRINEDDDV